MRPLALFIPEFPSTNMKGVRVKEAQKKEGKSLPFFVPKEDTLRGGFGGVEGLGKARNLARGLLPMDHALGGGFIQVAVLRS